MEDIINKITEYKDYVIEDSNNYSSYYQLHILTYNKVVSSYYSKESYQYEDIEKKVTKLFISIKSKSIDIFDISLFNIDGVFLITDNKTLIQEDELNCFNTDIGRYERSNEYEDVFSFLREINIDTFIESALITVGAKKIIPTLKNKLDNLLKVQNNSRKFWHELMEKEKGDPKYFVEIFKIEKNYIPRKIQEFKCASLEATYCLPEIKAILDNDKRATSIVKEISTGKTVEGSLEEAIESIKYAKWLKRNPPVIDLDVMQRMELDNDDPNFINYDEYFADKDEMEDGDEEYEPRF